MILTPLPSAIPIGSELIDFNNSNPGHYLNVNPALCWVSINSGPNEIEAGSTSTVFNVTGHDLRPGDLVQFANSGAIKDQNRIANSVTADTITFAHGFDGTPDVGATFGYYRKGFWKTDQDGVGYVQIDGGTIDVNAASVFPVQLLDGNQNAIGSRVVDRSGARGLDIGSLPVYTSFITDLAEAGSSSSLINATGHAARKGDLIRFSDNASVDVAGENSAVTDTAPTTITIDPPFAGAPGAGDEFTILRPTHLSANYLDSTYKMGLVVTQDGNDDPWRVGGTLLTNIDTNVQDISNAVTSNSFIPKESEGSAYAGGEPGVVGLGFIRRDSASVGTAANGSFAFPGIDASGRLWTNGSSVTQPISGTVIANAGSGTFAIAGPVTNAGTFAVQATQSGTWNIGTLSTITNVVHIDDNSSTISIDDASGSITVDGIVAISGTVAVTQSTSPWVVSGTVTASVGIGQGIQNESLTVQQATTQTTGNIAVDRFGQFMPQINTPFAINGSNDAAEAGSTVNQINATAHAVKIGDTVQFLGGVRNGVGYVTEVATDSFKISPPLRSAPQAGDFFYVQGGARAAVDANTGNLLVALQTNTGAYVHKLEDAAHVSGDPGFQVLGVRKSSPVNLSGTDGDYEPFQVNAGRLWVSATIDAAIPAGANIIGSLTANQSVNVAQINGVAPSMGNGASGTGVQRVTIANDSTGILALTTSVAEIGNVKNSGTFAVQAAQSGTWNIGTVTTITNVVHVDDNSSTLSIDDGAGSITVDGTVAVSGTVTISGAVTNAGTFAVQPAGSIAHDGAGTGVNPILIGGYASAAAPTDVSTDGDAVRGWYLKNGAQATVLTAAGALIGGDAANGLDVDVTRVSGTVTIAGAVTNAGTFAVQESGAALTALQLIDNLVTTEDTASANGDSGLVAFARRTLSPANTSGTDGDYEAFQISAGRLWVSATIDAALPVGANIIGALSANQSVNVAQINGVTPLMGNGASGTGAQRVTLANDSTGVIATVTTVTTVSTVTNLAQMNGVAITMGNGASGTGVQRVSLASDSTGNIATIGTSVTPGTGAANLGKAEDAVASSGDTGVAVLHVVNNTNATKAADGDYTFASTDASGMMRMVGNVAHDAADAGDPIKVGGKARQTNPTAVADADRVDASFDDLGRQIVVLGQVRDLITDQTTTITSSTSETTILTAVASTFLDITNLILTNSSNSAVSVTIKQSTAGTTRMIIDLAAKGGAVIPFARPMTQGAVNNNWTATCDVSVASVHIYAQAEKNV